MQVQLLSDLILIRRDPEAEKVGSILLPDQMKRPPSRGTVIASGPGLWERGKRQPMPVNDGDRVMFDDETGEPLQLNGERVVVMHADHLLGLVVPVMVACGDPTVVVAT